MNEWKISKLVCSVYAVLKHCIIGPLEATDWSMNRLFWKRWGAPVLGLMLAALVGGCRQWVAATYTGGDELIRSMVRPNLRPIHRFAQMGQVDEAREYLERLPFHVNSRASQLADRRPLHLAAEHNQPEMAAFLLAEGAKVNARDRLGRTALFLVQGDRRHKTMAILLDAGAEPDLADRLKITPLHLAAYRGDEETARMLLRYGAKVDPATPREQVTPLMLAVIGDRLDLAELLLAYGANCNRATKLGAKPLDLAARSAKLPMIKLLKERGAKPGAGKYSGLEFKYLEFN